MLAEAWASDIVTVVSTGNTRDQNLGAESPQRFGKEDNALITVGSMTADGELWINNPPVGPAPGGQDPDCTGTSGCYPATGNQCGPYVFSGEIRSHPDPEKAPYCLNV